MSAPKFNKAQFTSAYRRWLAANGYEPISQYWIAATFREYQQPLVYNFHFLAPAQAVDDAICAVCDGTREYVQPCPGCAALSQPAPAQGDEQPVNMLRERIATLEGEVELLRQDVAAHMATALAENERAEAAERAIHKERMLTDEVVGQLQELGKMYNEQARTIIELQKTP